MSVTNETFDCSQMLFVVVVVVVVAIAMMTAKMIIRKTLEEHILLSAELQLTDGFSSRQKFLCAADETR